MPKKKVVFMILEFDWLIPPKVAIRFCEKTKFWNIFLKYSFRVLHLVNYSHEIWKILTVLIHFATFLYFVKVTKIQSGFLCCLQRRIIYLKLNNSCANKMSLAFTRVSFNTKFQIFRNFDWFLANMFFWNFFKQVINRISVSSDKLRVTQLFENKVSVKNIL